MRSGRVNVPALRWLSGLALLGLLLAGLGAPGARAQTTHVHNWETTPDLRARGVTVTAGGGSIFPTYHRVRGVISVDAYLSAGLGFVAHGPDWDTCRVEDCPFLTNGSNPAIAANSWEVLCWSASRPGGEFGYLTLGISGTFVPSSDPAKITHYRCPPSPGPVTIGAKIDDVPTANDPYTQVPVTTADDAPALGSAPTVTVVGDTADGTVTWDPYTAIAVNPSIPSVVGAGPTRLVANASDVDRRVGDVTGTTIQKDILTYGWGATGPAGNGGTFYDSAGNVVGQASGFAGSGQYDEVYWVPPGPGTYTLSLVVADAFFVHDGGGSRHDPDWQASYTVTVTNTGVYWTAGTVSGTSGNTGISGGISAPLDSSTVAPSQAVSCTAVTGSDPDFRWSGGSFTQNNDTCTYRWSASDGTFLDSGGNPTTDPTGAQVTWIPATPGIQRLTLTIDDQNDANLPAGESGSRDDLKREYHVSVQVGDDLCPPRLYRTISAQDACGCPPCTARAGHGLDPLTGAVNFDIPVTSWTYRGLELGLNLHYNSDSQADPSMDRPNFAVNTQPDLARMSQRNSHWTHNWAQFVEVVQDETGLTHALWNTGDGGVVGFPQNASGGWDAQDSFLTLSSSGSTGTQVTMHDGTQEPVSLPYGQFDLTDGDGTVHEFHQVYWEQDVETALPRFLLTRIQDRWGRTVTLTWDSTGQLTHVKDGNNRGLDFAYGTGTLNSITDAQGRTHQLNYTYQPDERSPSVPQRKLTTLTVVGPGSPSAVYIWGFDYGSPSNSTDVSQGYGGRYTGDLVLRVTEPSQRMVHYDYERTNAGRLAYGDWDGRAKRMYYADAAEGNQVKALARDTTTFAATGPALVSPEGAATIFHYDGATHDLTEVTDNATGTLATTAWDQWHNPTSVSTNAEQGGDPLSSVVYTYGANGRTIDQAVAHNALTSLLGDEAQTLFGTFTASTGAPFSLPTRHTRVHRSTGGLAYDRVTQWVYDTAATRNLVSVTDGNGGSVTETATFTYGGTANRPPDVPDAVTDSLNRTSSSGFDTFGRVNRTTSPANPLAPAGSADRNPSISTLQYDADGLPTLLVDPLGQTNSLRQVKISYQASGSQLAVTMRRVADGSRRIVTVDARGLVVASQDEGGVRTSYSYNGDGQLLLLTEAVGRPESRRTRYQYDRDGNLVRLTPPQGMAQNSSVYDVVFDYRHYARPQNGQPAPTPGAYEGRLTRITHPDGTEEYRGYTASGDLDWVSRPYTAPVVGQQWCTTTFERDKLHRVTRVNYPASPQGLPAFTVDTTYDEFGRVTSETRTNTETGNPATTTYQYDELDRVTNVLPGDGRQSLSIQYFKDTTADPAGQMKRWITRTTLSGVTGTPGYWEEREDFKGRFSGTINPFGQSFSYEYDLGGRVIKQSNTNATSTVFVYDARDRLTILKHYRPNGTLLDQFRYTHHVTGRVASETDIRGQWRNFAYDGLGQLTAEQARDARASTLYQYDKNGNRTFVRRGAVATVGSRPEYYRVDAADRLLWTNGTNTAPTAGQSGPYSLFTYDYTGQLTHLDRRGTDGVRHEFDLLWDTDGRLREVLEVGTVLTATYDASGERVTKTDLATGSHVYSFGLHDSGEGGISYTPGFAQRKAGVDRTFHTDWLGSTRYLTDNSATATSGMRFNAYGERTAIAGTDGNRPTARQFAGVHGYEREALGGLELDHLSQRYYDSATGRFISRDPIGFEGGLNQYEYCSNDPLK